MGGMKGSSKLQASFWVEQLRYCLPSESQVPGIPERVNQSLQVQESTVQAGGGGAGDGAGAGVGAGAGGAGAGSGAGGGGGGAGAGAGAGGGGGGGLDPPPPTPAAKTIMLIVTTVRTVLIANERNFFTTLL